MNYNLRELRVMTPLPAMVHPLRFYKNHYYEACARRKNRPVSPEEEKIGYEFARNVAIKYAMAKYREIMFDKKFRRIISLNH